MSEPGLGELLAQHPHRRYNWLKGEWILVSPQRTQRPWQGAQEGRLAAPVRAYEPQCYLCPGNHRAAGAVNPSYESTFVFTNDFPALVPGSAASAISDSELLRMECCSGGARVLCYSPRHDVGLAGMSAAEVRSVVDTWAAQTQELSQRWRWVQIFENRGELMGSSNPHPHGQIWSSDFIPSEAERESNQQQHWFDRHGRALLLDYAQLELRQAERVVLVNDDWLVLVPWWATWPFETLLLARAPVAHLPQLSDAQRDSLVDVLQRLLRVYDGLFGVPFPYSFGWHQAPGGGERDAQWQLHAHFYPPLLRSASVKKHMVGYELLAEVQRDLTPEAAAEQLRSGASSAR